CIILLVPRLCLGTHCREAPPRRLPLTEAVAQAPACGLPDTGGPPVPRQEQAEPARQCGPRLSLGLRSEHHVRIVRRRRRPGPPLPWRGVARGAVASSPVPARQFVRASPRALAGAPPFA